ncbi:prepilin-type N-terminal cleavage/methylation domain-containing protein [Litoribrevibacter albus]|uniref:Prepilin-type N-terminal cleavage/methylation domain-containing protein n=1 Tax=Litoribrevibacter albus TaxID=1473156 RepID=A0AA37SE52_9GAMM|nr:prepilin-type N-terminal cleavage/methylation domain-containing protein [Litoribrevibacter albus]GLQ33676.1 hypothetical protein GCM10007876_41560 [Litoribrevibacter albus]
MKRSGFSLIEIMIVLLLSSLLSLACVEWFVSIARFYRSQALQIENQEVGHFSLTYLSKYFVRAGAGLNQSEPSVQFSDGSVFIRYNQVLPDIGVLKNCLGNSSRSSVIEDAFVVQDYIYGGNELKCISSGRGDWLTEGIEHLDYQVAVDQGAFEEGRFLLGQYDGVPDAYVSAGEFDANSMKALAIRVSVMTYRPDQVNKVHVDYWKMESRDNAITEKFTTLVILPNS